jgi:hypothetical protein
MALESEHSSQQSSTSTEDCRAYKRIVYGIFGFYAAAGIYLAGVAIAGGGFQKAAHFVMASWNQNGCASARIVAPSTATGLASGIFGVFSHSPSWNELSTTSQQRS